MGLPLLSLSCKRIPYVLPLIKYPLLILCSNLNKPNLLGDMKLLGNSISVPKLSVSV